jgi:NifU-like protein involved in Fe-S cluster formation
VAPFPEVAVDPDEDLYEARLLQAARRADGWPVPADAAGVAERVGRVCGTRVLVALDVDDQGCIRRYGHRLQHACALTRAAATVLAQGAVGADRTAVAGGLAALDRLLARKSGAGGEAGWPELAVLDAAADIPTRHASIRLPFEAVLAALEAVEPDRSGG